MSEIPQSQLATASDVDFCVENPAVVVGSSRKHSGRHLKRRGFYPSFNPAVNVLLCNLGELINSVPQFLCM